MPGSEAAAIKQNQDDRSVVPLDHPGQVGPAWGAHSREAFKGEQVRPHERAVQRATRDTLGARRVA